MNQIGGHAIFGTKNFSDGFIKTNITGFMHLVCIHVQHIKIGKDWSGKDRMEQYELVQNVWSPSLKGGGPSLYNKKSSVICRTKRKIHLFQRKHQQPEATPQICMMLMDSVIFCSFCLKHSYFPQKVRYIKESENAQLYQYVMLSNSWKKNLEIKQPQKRHAHKMMHPANAQLRAIVLQDMLIDPMGWHHTGNLSLG